MILVRPARADDAAAMSAVLIASIRELCTGDHRNDPEILDGWLENKSPERVARMLASPAASFFVAERDGVVAAVGAIGGADEISLNYVAPEHRFAGVSTAMVDYLEEELRARGVAVARLSSTGTARRFYTARGWRETGPGCPDRGMTCYPMEKPL